MHELELERAERHGVAGVELLERGLGELVLVELGAGHGHGQPAAVDHGDVVLPQLAQHPGQRAEVVLVAVGDHDRLEVVDALAQVGEVGQDEVDPELARGREAQADVDDHDPAVELDDHHVLADLAEPPEGQDLQRAHARAGSSSPWASRAVRTVSSSASSHGTMGRRSPPTSMPRRFIAALQGAGLAVTNMAA